MPIDLDVTPTSFQTTYNDHLVAAKDNYDAQGNLIGPLATSLIAQKPTAEYATVLDQFAVEVQSRLARYASEAALEALGTNDGIAVGDIQTLADGSMRICDTAAASTSTWSGVVLQASAATVGDGSGAVSPTLDVDIGASGTGFVRFLEGGTRRWAWGMVASGDDRMALLAYDGAGNPSTPGEPLSITTGGNTTLAGNLTVNGTQIFANVAAPLVILGNGSGAPILRVQKSAAGNASPLDLLSNGLRSWDTVFDANEDLRIDRYIAGSLQEAGTFKIFNASGLVALAKDLTVGSGTEGVVQIWDKGDANEVNLRLQNAGITRNALRMLSDETFAIAQYNASGVFQQQTAWDAAGNVTFPADVSVVGTHTMLSDSPIVYLDKSGTGTGAVWFTINSAAPQADDKRFIQNTNETLTCEHYNGSTWDVVWKIGNTSGGAIGWFGSSAAQQTVTGSRGGNAALASVLTALANYGIIIDSST